MSKSAVSVNAVMPKEEKSRKGKFVKAKVNTKLLALLDRNHHRGELNEKTEDSFKTPIEVPDADVSWRKGRRVVELGLVADQLRKCIDCGQRLFLDRTLNETRYGLASILHVQCHCGITNSINTGKSHHTSSSKKGMPAFDVNTKAALGMYLII